MTAIKLDATDFEVYKAFMSPTNPYSMYNNQDRFLNSIYRPFTTGEFKNLVEKIYIPHPEVISALSYRYEKITNITSQHSWATTALLGIGYSLNLSALGSSDAEKAMFAKMTLARSVINASLESTLYIANAIRYGNKMDPMTNDPSKYQDQVKAVRGGIGSGASFLFAANSLVSLGMSSKLLNNAIKKGDAVDIQTGSLAVLGGASNFLANTLKGLNGVASLRGATASIPKGLGIAGSVFGAINGLASISSLAPLLARTDLTTEQKAVIAAEMSVQFGGGITQVVCNAVLATRLASGITTGASILGPALGAAAGGLLLALSPLEIYGFVKQSQYADSLEELGREISKYGYEGDSLLASLYRDKNAAEASIMAVTTTLGIVGSAVSIAAAASVIGTPISVIVGLATAAVSGILKGVQQPIIEKIAEDYARKIQDQGGSFAYFAKSILAQKNQITSSEAAKEFLRNSQRDFGVDSVIGITTSKISKTALEFAAVIKTAADLKTAEAYANKFLNGNISADETIKLDSSSGDLVLGGKSGEKRLLTFLTPLMGPGEERRVRVSTGKDSYYTTLEIISKGDWSITDGAASTIFNLDNVASRFYGVDGTLKKEIQVSVNAGAGDDVVIAGFAKLDIDGGAGNDSISYASSDVIGIDVRVTASGFQVTKHLSGADVYVDAIGVNEYTYGKRTEKVEYREVLLKKFEGIITDRLRNVENIFGSSGADSITGDGLSNSLSGGAGNDRLDGGGGDDVLSGGSGTDQIQGGAGNDLIMQDIEWTYETIDGGAGTDTLDFSVTAFASGSRDLMGVTGVVADLSQGRAYKYKGYYDGVFDTVLNIENLVGSSLNDSLTGNAGGNVLSGGRGDDVLSGLAGDDYLRGDIGNDRLDGGEGNDVLAGCSGTDQIQGGAGDDLIMQDIEWTYESIDGGAGSDTLDYSVTEFASGSRDLMGVTGVVADLSQGRAYKYKGYYDGVFDTVLNVENLVGSSLNDSLTGDAGGNALSGGKGDDVLSGLAGDDYLVGDTGNDRLDGGEGDDVLAAGSGIDQIQGGAGEDLIMQDIERTSETIDGGAGSDTLDYSVTEFASGSRDLMGVLGIVADLSQGRAYKYKGYYDGVFDTVLNIENLVGSSLNDSLTGNAGDNALSGGQGDDVLSGLAGRDYLLGGSGNDRLDGGDGDDVLSAGSGSDVILGGAGDDLIMQDIELTGETIDGGAGSDTLDYSVTEFPSGRRDLIGTKGVVADLSQRRVYKYEGYDNRACDLVLNVENLVGSSLNDRLTGDAGDNALSGGKGDDVLSGLAGDDYLVGGIGNDSLDGGEGDDVLAGGSGSDVILGGAGNDLIMQDIERSYESIDGGAGTDTLDYSVTEFASGSRDLMGVTGVFADLTQGRVYKYKGYDDGVFDTVSNVENLVGSSLNDSLTGDAANNVLTAGKGDDALSGLAGDDYLLGGIDNDRLDGGEGDDVLAGGSGTDQIQGGAGNDLIMQDIERTSETIDGGAGSDTLDYSVTEFASGSRDLMGGTGVFADLTQGRVYKYKGYDDGVFDTVSNVENLVGSSLNDNLTGDAGGNALSGGQGNDVLSGLAGKDYLLGGSGDDRLDGGDGDDVLAGGSGTDVILGGAGDDLILEDIERTSESIDGGAGTDTLDYSATEFASGSRDLMGVTGVFADLTQRRVYKYKGYDDGVFDMVRNIENLVGSSLNDSLAGDAGGNVLSGGQGNDVLSGRAGDDYLLGGSGDDRLDGGDGGDVLTGGSGADQIQGGAGDDLIMQDIERISETIDGGAGSDTLDYSVTEFASGSRDLMGETGVFADLTQGRIYKYKSYDDGVFDTVLNIENLVGSSLNDSLTGDAGDNALSGGEGEDVLSGLAGKDYLLGGSGDDRLDGGDGDDVLAGGSGSDLIQGGAGNDLIMQDIDWTYESIDGGAGFDTLDYSVTEFASGSRAEMGVKGVFADLTQGRVYKYKGDFNSGAFDVVRNIENLVGSSLNDSLAGNSGDNVLSGGQGDDVLSGRAGDDYLMGGTGNDSLDGGVGNDTYVFGRGYGSDTVVENDSTANNADEARFLAGITMDQLWFSRTTGSDNLDVSIIGTADKLTIKDWYVSSANHVESFKTSDGKTLMDSQVQNLVNAMAAFAPPSAGQITLPQNYQSALSSAIAVNWA